MPKGSYRITKAEFYRMGGLRNSKLWRRQDAAGRWQHFRCYD